MAKQTCLEKFGINERHDEITRSDYNIENAYGPTHKDALSDGDAQGKGTGGGHTHWLPSCDGGVPSNRINYSNFSTSPEDQIGGLYDIEGRGDFPGRKTQIARSLYNYENTYGSTSVDTTQNQADGQFIVK